MPHETCRRRQSFSSESEGEREDDVAIRQTCCSQAPMASLCDCSLICAQENPAHCSGASASAALPGPVNVSVKKVCLTPCHLSEPRASSFTFEPSKAGPGPFPFFLGFCRGTPAIMARRPTDCWLQMAGRVTRTFPDAWLVGLGSCCGSLVSVF